MEKKEKGRKDFGEIIASNRKKAGLSQEKLADKLGVSLQSICRYENNETIPNAEIFMKIAQALDVSTVELTPDEYQSKSSMPLAMQKFFEKYHHLTPQEKAACKTAFSVLEELMN